MAPTLPSARATGCAIEIERFADRLAPHPEDGDAGVIRREVARIDRVDKLRREREPDNIESALRAVQGHKNRIAGIEAMRAREGFKKNDFVCARNVDRASRDDMEKVEGSAAMFRR